MLFNVECIKMLKILIKKKKNLRFYIQKKGKLTLTQKRYLLYTQQKF